MQSGDSVRIKTSRGPGRRLYTAIRCQRLLGHESAGVVSSRSAPDVTYVNPGDHVVNVPVVGILRHLRQLLDRAAGPVLCTDTR